MSKLMEIEKRYEQLEQCVAYVPTVEENAQTSFIHSIQNEIHALWLEHKKLIQKIENSKKPYVKFLPCTCGHNRRELWAGFTEDYECYWYYKCLKCGLKGDGAPSAEAAKVAWNKMIIGKTEGNNDSIH